MTPVVATCTQELVDGQCPPEAVVWTAWQLPTPQTGSAWLEMPSADVLMKVGHDVAIAFILPTFMCVLAALAVVWIHDAIS